MFAFWSAAGGIGGRGIHAYRLLPWHQSTTDYPKHWPANVGQHWVEARRSVEGKNWTAAALMARSAVQLVARSHGAVGKNLKEEIDDLAAKSLILPIMKEWAHEVRVLANEGTHPQPGTKGTNEKDANDVVEFLSFLMTVMYNLPNQIEEYRKRKSQTGIPDSFDLVVDVEHSNQHSHVVWRKARRIGVAFDQLPIPLLRGRLQAKRY